MLPFTITVGCDAAAAVVSAATCAAAAGRTCVSSLLDVKTPTHPLDGQSGLS